ncbi:MAG: GNAT family N-acetyltransferase [Firmicutes bacterium]|nr:GNAT family N-acetyltransferase [Bacillota bacterium]
MKYDKVIILKDGRECRIRNAAREDGEGVLRNFLLTHGETDFLTSYPDECTFTVEGEEEYMERKEASEREAEIVAEIDGEIVGTSGISSLGTYDKLKHRAVFGISVAKEYWGLGIGRALTECCIECARKAGYLQLELEAVADNKAALALYESAGFREYGRNPKAFRSRISGWQECVLMRLEL